MIRRTWDWLLEGGWLWLTSVLLLSLAIIFWSANTFFDCKERDLRLLGLLLQVFGFLTVAMGLHDVSRHFGRPNTLVQVREYFKAVPFLSREQRSSTGTGGLVTKKPIVQVSGHINAAEGASLESRLTRLEESANFLHAQIGKLDTAQQQMKADTEAALKLEAEKRQRGDADLQRTIETTIAGGVSLEWLGVIYFVAGVVLATAAPEIASVLGSEASCSVTFKEFLAGG